MRTVKQLDLISRGDETGLDNPHVPTWSKRALDTHRHVSDTEAQIQLEARLSALRYRQDGFSNAPHVTDADSLLIQTIDAQVLAEGSRRSKGAAARKLTPPSCVVRPGVAMNSFVNATMDAPVGLAVPD